MLILFYPRTYGLMHYLLIVFSLKDCHNKYKDCRLTWIDFLFADYRWGHFPALDFDNGRYSIFWCSLLLYLKVSLYHPCQSFLEKYLKTLSGSLGNYFLLFCFFKDFSSRNLLHSISDLIDQLSTSNFWFAFCKIACRHFLTLQKLVLLWFSLFSIYILSSVYHWEDQFVLDWQDHLPPQNLQLFISLAIKE